MTSLINIINLSQSMKWLQIITSFLKKMKGALKLTRIAQASLAISIVLLCRKMFKLNIQTNAQTKVMLENISAFYNKLRNNNIKNVSILADSINYTDINQKIFSAVLPKHAQATLESQLRANNINFNYLTKAASKSNVMLAILMWATLGFAIYMLFNNRPFDLSTSSKPQKTVTFDNIVGLQQCKQSLREIIEFMRQPQKYTQIGARMRKGIIFYGPSGTGKTTLAKATAGEAGVPFFSCNASQFCEIYVGVGPKRVRQLFAKAKQSAPSIIYIDQIDAIGNRKQTGIFNQGANTEKNTTINQLLSQMDGFSSQENVLVIGSTNRLQMIDQSLLRAGRFDLKIKIPLPNEEDRFQILKYHLSGKKSTLSDQFLRKSVRDLQNWSGADLQNLANQSVYASLRAQRGQIDEQTLTVTLRRLQQQFCH